MIREFELTYYTSLTADIGSAINKSYPGMIANFFFYEDLRWKSFVLAYPRFKSSYIYDRFAEQLSGVFARHKNAVERKVREAVNW